MIEVADLVKWHGPIEVLRGVSVTVLFEALYTAEAGATSLPSLVDAGCLCLPLSLVTGASW